MDNTSTPAPDESTGVAASSESRKRRRTPAVNNTTAAPTVKHAFLKDRVTPVTIYPIPPSYRLPQSILLRLCSEFNHEIDNGTTFPFTEHMLLPQFQSYWFSSFAGVMLKGRDEMIRDGRDWESECIGTFMVLPRYPGRSAHVCTGQFLVCENFRGKGAGKLLVNTFLDYAMKLGYSSALFDLIYETNDPILAILDSLSFKRIGTIKSAGHLLNHSEPVDSIIISRDLIEEEDLISNERFEKIRYYLEKGKYPPSATRPEKSRLRSAATHYKLVGDKLMLKDKQVISDPQKQYEIARDVHKVNHGGINKTTAQIADRYHWIQIKKTVSQVLKNCVECTQNARPPVVKAIKSKDGECSETPTNSQENNENEVENTEAMIDIQSVPGTQEIIQSDVLISIPSPIPPLTLLDRPVKSPPGHHHHQLAQSIRSQHDAMSLSQRNQIAEAANMSVNINLTNANIILDEIPVDPAMMDGVVHHHHHQHQHDQAHEISMMDNFDDIRMSAALAGQEFDGVQANMHDLLVQQGLITGADGGEEVVGMGMDEESRRHHAHATALAAEAVMSGAGGDGDEDEMDPFRQRVGVHQDY